MTLAWLVHLRRQRLLPSVESKMNQVKLITKLVPRLNVVHNFLLTRLAIRFMNIVYIEAAAKVITNKQQLINMVSKRVRQLSAGSRPMVETNLSMGLADIALSEIAEGKLTMDFFALPEEENQAA